LFNCIERAFKKAYNEAIAFGYERKEFKPQKVFQGFKNLGSLPLCLSIFFFLSYLVDLPFFLALMGHPHLF